MSWNINENRKLPRKDSIYDCYSWVGVARRVQKIKASFIEKSQQLFS